MMIQTEALSCPFEITAKFSQTLRVSAVQASDSLTRSVVQKPLPFAARPTLLRPVEPQSSSGKLPGLPKPLPLGATATTAASGGNREELLGPRPAGCKRQRSRRWEPQPGQWHCVSADGEVESSSGSRSGSPSYNLSVGLAPASSPSRGASEEAKLCGMPRPPLVRGGGIAKQ